MKAAGSSRMARARHAARGIVAAALAMASAAAGAADLQVSPILVEFGAREQAAAVWLSNTGKQPLRAQVRIQAWTQEGDQDVLEATRDLVASPAILEVAPGGKQMVRIIRLQPAPLAQESAYRLLVDELPGDPGEDRKGLQFLLRYSIPVFITAAGPDEARADARVPEGSTTPSTDLSPLRLQLEAGAGGSRLRASNTGARRIRISQLSLVDADGHEHSLNQGLLGYVLAGHSMAWPLPLALPLKTGQILKARFNDDLQAQPLPLHGPGH
jgi:fimbrial chaperone protein